jgi:hypothetical protein
MDDKTASLSDADATEQTDEAKSNQTVSVLASSNPKDNAGGSQVIGSSGSNGTDKVTVGDDTVSSSPVAVSEEGSSNSLSEEPVVVKPEDLPAPDSETERLQEQIELLTGEIQALEAKIERMMNGSTAADSQSQSSDVPDKTTSSQTQQNTAAPTPEVSSAPKPEPAAFSPAPATPSPNPNSPLDDIYSSIGKPRPLADPSIQEQLPQPSAVAVVGEVLVILGTILFLVLSSAPLFREIIGEDLYQVIRSVGWLTTVSTLLLGLLMGLFGKAKAVISSIGFVFLLLSALVYLGINYPSLLSPFGDSLVTLFDFYR